MINVGESGVQQASCVFGPAMGCEAIEDRSAVVHDHVTAGGESVGAVPDDVLVCIL